MELTFSKSDPVCTVDEGYAQCAEFARRHSENFTVGSWMLPEGKRRLLYAIYAFCRLVDNLGDEFSGDRLKALDELEREILNCYEREPRNPYMVALQDTIRTFDIPKEPFLRLIEANRMDQRNNRYDTYMDLQDYCEHSANPVGHLVLYVFGYRDAERQRLSDYTCTALQLANFWQDVDRDYQMGRIYIPMEDMAEFACSEKDIAQKIVTSRFREMMKFEVERTRVLFLRGLEMLDVLDGRLKLDVALYTLAGMKVLDLIEGQNYDVYSRRPMLSKATKISLMMVTTVKILLGLRVGP